jgi:hypothetical protein
METRTLGPRSVPFVRATGEEGAGSILVTFGEPEIEVLDNGDQLEEKSGWVDVEFDGEAHRFSAWGADDLQLTYYLLRKAGEWLVVVSRARDITLFDYRPEPVVAAMDVFDC